MLRSTNSLCHNIQKKPITTILTVFYITCILTVVNKKKVSIV